MITITAITKVRIWGTKNCWSLSPDAYNNSHGTDCSVELEIQGDDRNGYHLVMSPSGFFTADNWYETQQDAIDDAIELFGVHADQWSTHDT